jgi:hypothetical protein
MALTLPHHRRAIPNFFQTFLFVLTHNSKLISLNRMFARMISSSFSPTFLSGSIGDPGVGALLLFGAAEAGGKIESLRES